MQLSKTMINCSVSPPHLSVFTISSVSVRIRTCQCFLSSTISVVIWVLVISSFTRSRHLNFDLPRFHFPSTVIYMCIVFIVASTFSRLCTCPNHLNLFSLRNSAIGYMCASFQISTFLIIVSPLVSRNMRISVRAISSSPSF